MGQWRVTADIPATAHGPATARRVIDAMLRGWGLDRLAEDAQLVASELVTNAYQHAPGTASFELQVVGQGDRLRICLADGSSVRPMIRDLDRDRPHGRGMRIVESLASGWGSDHHGGGKLVWVELR
jgi:anti-sigma regulatory factor (Ser/Thr protein kinase)